MTDHGLGCTIKALRKLRGLTQKELADRVGMNRSSISQIEAGRQTLTSETLPKIAQALGYRVKYNFVPEAATNRGNP